jgi:hypothetical protein
MIAMTVSRDIQPSGVRLPMLRVGFNSLIVLRPGESLAKWRELARKHGLWNRALLTQ